MGDIVDSLCSQIPFPQILQPIRNNFLESLRTSDEMCGAEGRPIHALEKAGEMAGMLVVGFCTGSSERQAQSDLDLWFSLANTTYFPAAILAMQLISEMAHLQESLHNYLQKKVTFQAYYPWLKIQV